MSITVTTASAWTGTSATTIGGWLNGTTAGTWAAGISNSTNVLTTPQYLNLYTNIATPTPITSGVLTTQPRRPPPREFNRYVNASDLIEEFIAWVGTQGVRQSEVMALPLESFIKWLIIRACEEDQEEPNVELVLPPARRQPRCLGCGRFLARRTPVALCKATCADRHFNRMTVR